MTLAAVEIIGYRSIRKIRFPVRQLSVLVGGNGDVLPGQPDQLRVQPGLVRHREQDAISR